MTLQVGDDPPRLFLGAADDFQRPVVALLHRLRALRLQLLQIALILGAQLLQVTLGLRRLLALAVEVHATLAHFAQGVFDAEALAAEELPRHADDAPGQAEALGNLQSVAAPRLADEQAVRGLERLHVEFDGGVLHAIGGVCKDLEVVVVRRGDSKAAGAVEFLEDRLSQRGPFGGVGAGAEFIEEDEAVHAVPPSLQGGGWGVGRRSSSPRLHPTHDLDDLRHVRAERGERLLDALLVADVCPDRLEDVDLRARLSGDVQARLRHEREQADGLERDGLAAGVGAGDEQRAELVAEPEINRHDLALQERVPRLLEVDDTILTDDRRGGVHAAGQPAAGVHEVEADERVQIAQEVRRGRADLRGQFAQQALDLRDDLDLDLAQFVADLDDLEGLDEDGGAAVGTVVDNAAQLPLPVAAHRQAEAPLTLDDDGVLEHFIGRRLAHQAVHAVAGAALQDSLAAVQMVELIRGVAPHFAVVVEHPLDLLA